MRTVALLVNPDKPRSDEVQAQIEQRLHDASINTYSESVHRLGVGGTIHEPIRQAEMACVIGGDGTLLGVARQLAPFGVPLLGINVGHLGFLSEAEPADLNAAVARIVAKDYALERRIMIEATVHRDGTVVDRLIGLNDAGIGKGSVGRMCTVEVFVDDVLVDAYRGDGVIVSTPTGSTAYSLSCGGPIVSPHLAVLVVTPICPHTLVARPCVIDVNQTICVKVFAAHDDLALTVDGQTGVRLQPGDEVTIRKSIVETTLVKLRQREFFTLLRTKLHGSLTPLQET